MGMALTCDPPVPPDLPRGIKPTWDPQQASLDAEPGLGLLPFPVHLPYSGTIVPWRTS